MAMSQVETEGPKCKCGGPTTTFNRDGSLMMTCRVCQRVGLVPAEWIDRHAEETKEAAKHE